MREEGEIECMCPEIAERVREHLPDHLQWASPASGSGPSPPLMMAVPPLV